MKLPKIIIRYGAGLNTLTVDGRIMNLAAMTRADRNKTTRLLVGALDQSGYFGGARA